MKVRNAAWAGKHTIKISVEYDDGRSPVMVIEMNHDNRDFSISNYPNLYNEKLKTVILTYLMEKRFI